MAVQTITYGNKSYINQNPDIADTNKVNATDMNEIKSIVNNNATELDTTSTLVNGMMKLKKYVSSMTVAGGSTATANMGSVPSISGYTFVGIIPLQTGYADQWITTFSEYSGKIQVMIRSFYSGSLTANVACYALFIKTDYYNSILVS